MDCAARNGIRFVIENALGVDLKFSAVELIVLIFYVYFSF